jgi:membrane glycosyltransferase
VAAQATSAICNERLCRNLARIQQQTNDLLERITASHQRSSQELASAIHDDVPQTVVATPHELEGFRELVTLARATTSTVSRACFSRPSPRRVG